MSAILSAALWFHKKPFDPLTIEFFVALFYPIAHPKLSWSHLKQRYRDQMAWYTLDFLVWFRVTKWNTMYCVKSEQVWSFLSIMPTFLFYVFLTFWGFYMTHVSSNSYEYSRGVRHKSACSYQIYNQTSSIELFHFYVFQKDARNSCYQLQKYLNLWKIV